MNLVLVGRLIVLYGLLVLCICDVNANHPLKPGKTKKNQNKHAKSNQHGADKKVTYKNLSKNLLKRLDSSCKNTLPPDLPNGKFLRFNKVKMQNGKSKSTHYMVAEFKCNEGYNFRIPRSGQMFCSRTKWVGNKPVCDRIRHDIDSLQGDDPNAESPPLPLGLEECPLNDKSKCAHKCRMYDGNPMCECLPGFQKEGNSSCKDIDECETGNGGCFHTCTNTLGSFACSCLDGFRLSSDEKSCEDVNECHLRNGHGPCQDTCENTPGTYRCGCSSLEGTRLALDLHTCADVNECTEGTSGCSHSCINTHGRAFCTCPEGMELGPDWKTCQDVDECEDPEIKSICKFGCVNFIGSYYCAKHSNETLSDQAVTNNETVPKEGEDYEEEDDYDDDYEDEGDYDDEDEYDESRAVEKELNIVREESTTLVTIDEDLVVDPPDLEDRIDENYTERDKVQVGKEGTDVKEDSTLQNTGVVTTTEVVNETLGGDIRNSDKYDDNDDYDEDYEEKEKEVTTPKTISTSEEATPDVTESDFETTSIKETDIKTVDEVTLQVPVTISTITETTIINNVTDNRNYNEQFPEESNTKAVPSGNEVEHTTVQEIPNKEIQNRVGEDYDDDYEEEPGKRKPYHENNVSAAGSSVGNRVNDLLKVNVTKERENEDANYDDDTDEEDYDDEYYDEDLGNKKSTTKSPVEVTSKVIDAEREHIKKIVSKLPEVDIDKINTDIHQIIANNTNVDDDYEDTTTIIATTTSSSSSGKNYGGKGEPDDDYDEGDDKELKKEESDPVGKEVPKCEKGFVTDENGKCTDIDECEAVPKLCSDGCQNTIGSYLCTCPPGFFLSPSDLHSCQDVDECIDSPCSHICVNDVGFYHCECPSGLTLQNSSCVNLTCSHGQTKINGVIQCTCPSGFILGTDQRSCEDVDECLFSNDCSHLCRNTIGSYNCGCETGFQLENGRTCVDVDECKGNHSCPQLCQNLPGTFQCACEEGYAYNKENNTCDDVNECDETLDLDECNQICVNYEGGYECACNTGYKLSEDDATCEDVNECLDSNGNCPQICNNLPGTYQCSCKIGYALNSDNQTCDVSDPCVEENGGCSHYCVNENGVAVCKCPKGQVLEGTQCYIYDPCVTNNGGCSHVCSNFNGKLQCDCPIGYELMNMTTCVQVNLCSVSNGNCSHFCEFVEGKVNCMCPESYILENNTKCVETDRCLVNNGGCSHICTFENHAVICACPATHSLRNETHCFEKNPCLTNNGGCSDICDFSNDTLTCSCPENFHLEGKTCYRIDSCLKDNGGCSHDCMSDEDGNTKCTCPKNFQLREDNKTCTLEDPCLTNNGGCSHKCNSSTGKAVCSCPRGFKLKDMKYCEAFNPCLMENGGCSHFCENVKGQAMCSCPKDYDLKDFRNCIPTDPCLKTNGGCSHTCTNVNNKATCSCPENYTIKDSKTCIYTNPCDTNKGGCSHLCNFINNETQCSCPDHYNLINETTCEEVDPCFINNGGCSHTCASEGSEVFCLCPDGHHLEGKKCIRINPCDNKNGGCSHVCSSINGRVICKCPPGYELIKKTCFKINPCMINNGGCPHGCTNVRGQAKCTTPRGSRVLTRKTKEDPCALDNGGCSHSCYSKEGRRECSCPAGYLLRPNKRVCKEINECKVNRGGCSHGCKNLPGSYKCTCPYGYELSRRDNKTCEDIDECRANKGSCEMLCRNLEGSYRCECPEGYVLQRDKRSCKRDKTLQCHVLKSPQNGVLKCNVQILENDRLVPSGTSCSVWCNEGYKLEGRSEMSCIGNGIWDEPEPHCSVATCPSLPPIQNGWYLPGICNSGRTFKGESCEVYCRKGFKRRSEFDRFICGDNLRWNPPSVAENLKDACVRDIPTTYIRCPANGFLDFTLPTGQRDMLVRIPRPEFNIDFRYVTSSPSWGMHLEAMLSAGRHEVRFDAMSPSDYNVTATCTLVINVMDKEEPRVNDCPEDLERHLLRGENMQIVHWREPIFHDNIGVVNVYKSREPGSEFGPGLHRITYVANDEAGNRAFCYFNINVKEFDSEVSNSVQQHATYTTYNTAGMYKAVLICPGGVRYMSNSPDSYSNMMAKEEGCRWEHLRVTRPMQPQSFRIPMYARSRLPFEARSNRRQFFKWNR